MHARKIWVRQNLDVCFLSAGTPGVQDGKVSVKNRRLDAQYRLYTSPELPLPSPFMGFKPQPSHLLSTVL